MTPPVRPPTDELGIPLGPVHTSPVGYRPRAQQEAVIRDALRGVELGAWDEQMVRWLAGWDWCTAATIVSWVGRKAAAEREARENGGGPWLSTP